MKAYLTYSIALVTGISTLLLTPYWWDIRKDSNISILSKLNGFVSKNIVKGPNYGYVAEGAPKLIYAATQLWQNMHWSEMLKFDNCEYSNCVFWHSAAFERVHYADIVLFAKVRNTKRFPKVPREVRQRQYWLTMSVESGAFGNHRFPKRFNDRFNGSMMYRRDSTIYSPFGKSELLAKPSTAYKFSLAKPKGAFAYVSRCKSVQYDRLAIMDVLAKYIDVDIFSANCHGANILPPPCPRLRTGSNQECETRMHKQYRFFLAFENSLCKDYISEKFWDRLKSPSNFVPVAMGGLSLEEYASVAPSDSFLHVYNFSSVHKLGEYMRYLSVNDGAYNEYHKWRAMHRINTDKNMTACQLCEIAHKHPYLPAIKNISAWRNNKSACMSYELH